MPSCPDPAGTLSRLYATYNDRSWLDPDPLLVVLGYESVADMEVAGLLSAALALGNARLIMKAARQALEPLGARPAKTLAGMGDATLRRHLAGFTYRFFDGGHLAAFLGGIRGILTDHPSIEDAFLAHDDPAQPDYAAAASGLVRELAERSPGAWPSNLLPDPGRGSASKRTFLFLRWMVRKDAVDPGVWTRADPGRLLVPLDTHMAAACRRLGFLRRSSVDLAAAREATASLRAYSPDDPLRYDFCMTRPGIRDDLDPDSCFES